MNETIYALDATTIDLCLSVFPWAPFRKNKAAVKLHKLHDLGATFPHSSILQTASCTMSALSIFYIWNPVHITLWAAAIWTSKDFINWNYF